MTKKQLKLKVSGLETQVFTLISKLSDLRNEFIMQKREIKDFNDKINIIAKELNGELIKEDYIEKNDCFNPLKWKKETIKVIKERFVFKKTKKSNKK